MEFCNKTGPSCPHVIPPCCPKAKGHEGACDFYCCPSCLAERVDRMEVRLMALEAPARSPLRLRLADGLAMVVRWLRR